MSQKLDKAAKAVVAAREAVEKAKHEVSRVGTDIYMLHQDYCNYKMSLEPCYQGENSVLLPFIPHPISDEDYRHNTVYLEDRRDAEQRELRAAEVDLIKAEAMVLVMAMRPT
ncbi:MAG: hypothetical protein WC505_05885 [Patescibacteria group bacterium]